jgi:hypothetical protein
MSDEPSKKEPSEAAKRVTGSLVEHRSVIRSLITAPNNAIPLEKGDPVPGGIRPGPETNHELTSKAEGSASSSVQPPKPE